MKNLIALCILGLIAGCGNDPVPPAPKPPVPTSASVKIGSAEIAGQSYKWSPAAGLDNPLAAQPVASPKCTTAYEVTATNQCGIAKSSTVVHVFKKDKDGELVEVKCTEGESDNGPRKKSAGLRLDGSRKAS